MAKPTLHRLGRVSAALDLLESHHSRPYYSTIRLMGWDSGRLWKGTWGNGGKGSGKSVKGKAHNNQPQKKTKEVGKGKGSDRDLFPDYDKMTSDGPDLQQSASASSSSSAAENQALKKVVRALAEASSMEIPPEVAKFLKEDPEEDMRTELKKTQQTLNKKRKIHGKILRLRETLTTKKDQFQKFKEAMREKLLTQQEKFEEDIRGIEAAIKDSEEQLKELGEEEETKSDAAMEDPEKIPLELAEILDINKVHVENPETKKERDELKEQLSASRMETAITKRLFNNQAQQLQMYMDRLETMQSSLMALQGAGMGAVPGVETMVPLNTKMEPLATSPQMAKSPVIPKRKIDPLSGKFPQPPSAEKKQRQGDFRDPPHVPTDGSVQVVEDSPPKEAKPGLFSPQDGMD